MNWIAEGIGALRQARRRLRRGLAAAVAVLAALGVAIGAGGPPALADVLVVSSTAPQIKAGTELPDTARLEVPAGAKVLVMLPGGATLTIPGPTSRPVRDITKGEPVASSIWSKVKDLLVSGGADQTRPGATRSIGQVRPSEAPLSWRLVGAAATGNVCVEADAPLEVERPSNLPPAVAELTILDTVGGGRGVVAFPLRASRAPWPAGLVPRADAVYRLSAPGVASRDVRLRLVGRAATGDDLALKTLLENDCLAQARAATRPR